MTDNTTTYDKPSPFHPGEQQVQSRMGVRDKMERFGQRVIRDHMPEQHQAFYQQLPFVFVGFADSQGCPWASILFNDPGFVTSPDNQTLDIGALPVKGDPLNDSIVPGTRLGMLGIELTTRRRNRLAAHIVDSSAQHIRLGIDQTFGNCPQYIQLRELEKLDLGTSAQPTVDELTTFDERAQQLILNSDTFFVASHISSGTERSYEGADVSHRGGKPGFIRIDNDKTLTIPDYLGNFHFNTLGNFIENAKAGLLFIDFESGDMLTVTGTAEIIWDSPDLEHFAGAQRLWKFHISHGRRINNGLPLRWKLGEYSKNTLLTGTWDEAAKLEQAQEQKHQWLPYKVVKVVKESEFIRSFYLATEGHQRATFLPGQFLTLKAQIDGAEHIRTYTVSSAPADEHFRISVKREAGSNNHPQGVFSNFIHSQLKVGDSIECKAPCGAFIFDATVKRPAVLLAGGVGITPMVSMARHALVEGMRTRYTRSVTLIAAAHNADQRAFFTELNEINEQSKGNIRTFWALSETDSSVKPGKDFHHRGRISADLLQGVLPLDDYDFYLCGPAEFMQSLYDMLIKLGVSDARIDAEAFGPASLKRDETQATDGFKPQPSAAEAIVQFSDSKVEQAWSQEDGSLLDFAQAHGLNPDFGCRSGQCGACKTKLVSGKVAYQTAYTAEVGDDEVLLCCATPAHVEGEAVVKLQIEL